MKRKIEERERQDMSPKMNAVLTKENRGVFQHFRSIMFNKIAKVTAIEKVTVWG